MNRYYHSLNRLEINDKGYATENTELHGVSVATYVFSGKQQLSFDV